MAAVRLERTVDDSRFEDPVVLLRVSLDEAADGPSRVQVTDSIPIVDPDVAFPTRTADTAEWTVEDGNQIATLTLDPGETVVTGYAVRDATTSMLERGSADSRVLGSTSAGGTTAERRLSKRAVLGALVLVSIVALAAGAVALLSNGPAPGPEGEPAVESTVETVSTTETPPPPADTDGDGLTDKRERELGTDPQRADSDDDGLTDGREMLIGTDPTAADTEGDGLTDARELALNTDPTRADTDGDGLSDSREAGMAVDPALADTDGDGLDDPVELDGPTAATDRDTDGDGLPDGAEGASEYLPDSDPLQKDVFVEIDHTGKLELSAAKRERLVGLFAEAPVENPGNETGIHLHLLPDDGLPTVGVLDESTFDRYRQTRFDRSCMGYHYAVLAPRTTVADAANRDVTDGAAVLGGGAFISDTSAFTFLHELGHSLGLDHGPDVPYTAYPSAMNYNIRQPRYGFSDGTNSQRDRDDWGYLESEMATLSAGYFIDPFVPSDSTCP